MIPKRIGIIVPSTNTSVEADFQRVLTPAVTVHSARLLLPDGVMTEASLDQMNRDLKSAIELLASAHVDLIAYGCTSGSFYRGPAWDEEVKATVERMASVPCVTTSTAVKAALHAFGARRLSVVTPYPAWTNERLRAYYEHEGFEILGVHGDARAAANGHRAINDQNPADVLDFALSHLSPQADALFCSCTALRAFEVVETLEAQGGKPVVTSNQATIWAAVKGVGALGCVRPVGRLFGLGG